MKFFRKILCVLLLVQLVGGMARFSSYVPAFIEFKVKELRQSRQILIEKNQKTYRKIYSNGMAENRAFLNFVKNKKLVDDFNEKYAEDAGFVLSINK
jgi:hypothetical protein